MERDSFIFYNSFYIASKELNDEQFARVMRALLDLSLNGKEYQGDDPIIKMFITLVKPQIDANNKRYENGKLGAEYGKKGGRPRKTPEEPQITEIKTPKKPLENPILTPNVNVNVNDNVNVNTLSNASAQKFEHIDKVTEEFQKTSHYETLLMQRGIEKEQAREILKIFVSDCKLRGDEVISIQDFRLRFSRALPYLLKELKINSSSKESNIAKGW